MNPRDTAETRRILVHMNPRDTSETRRILVHALSENGYLNAKKLRTRAHAQKPAHDIARIFLSTGLPPHQMDLVVDILGEPLPTQMHWSMFLHTLQTLASPAQREYWIPRCFKDVIGCYAQTELGGGSDVKGIETTAVRERDHWVLHSPTLTSMKFWPGGLGRTATHALVVASAGSLRMFIVDLSSEGVTRGSVGKLLGFQAADNGWMRMNHVKVPLDAALPAVSRGTLYGTMRHTRKRIVRASIYSLAKAVTIAYSFACLREQPKGTRIIEHTHVKHTLQKWTAWIESVEYKEGLAFKAYITDEVAKGIEECRRICGGFGYAYLSGFPRLLTNHLATVTYEGSNEMLYEVEAKRRACTVEQVKARYSVDADADVHLDETVRSWDISKEECQSALVADTAHELYAQITSGVHSRL